MPLLRLNSGIIPQGYPEWHIPEENPAQAFPPHSKIRSELLNLMKKIGTVMCLIALASSGGGISSSTTSSGLRISTSAGELSIKVALDPAYQAASLQRKRNDYQGAADLFAAGLREARRRQEPELEAHFLWGLGNCYFAQRRYR